jgi:hypothetical protein
MLISFVFNFIGVAQSVFLAVRFSNVLFQFRLFQFSETLPTPCKHVLWMALKNGIFVYKSKIVIFISILDDRFRFFSVLGLSVSISTSSVLIKWARL